MIAIKETLFIDMETIYNKINDDFIKARDINELSIRSFIYIECFVNKILEYYLKKPVSVIYNDGTGCFLLKLAILNTLGYFDKKTELFNNLNLLYKIRNYFLRALPIEKEINLKIIDKIKKLTYLDLQSNIIDPRQPYFTYSNPLKAQLAMCSISIIKNLAIIDAGMEAKVKIHKDTLGN